MIEGLFVSTTERTQRMHGGHGGKFHGSFDTASHRSEYGSIHQNIPLKEMMKFLPGAAIPEE